MTPSIVNAIHDDNVLHQLMKSENIKHEEKQHYHKT